MNHESQKRPGFTTEGEAAVASGKKQCPVCYRICERDDNLCIGCGAELVANVSILRPPRRRPVAAPADVFRLHRLLLYVLTFRPSAFYALGSGHAPSALYGKIMMLFIASWGALLVRAAVVYRLGRVSFSLDYDVLGVLFTSIFQLLLMLVVLLLANCFFAATRSGLLSLTLIALVVAMSNLMRIIEVPVAFIPKNGLDIAEWILMANGAWLAITLALVLVYALGYSPASGIVGALALSAVVAAGQWFVAVQTGLARQDGMLYHWMIEYIG